MLFFFKGENNDSCCEENVDRGERGEKADAGLLEPEHLLQHQTEAPGKESLVRKLMLDSWNQSIFSNIKQRLQVKRAPGGS
jgi:hypothetical protein